MGLFNFLFGSANNTALKQALQGGAFLVDVRTPAEFAGGSAEGAVNIPLDKVSSRLDAFKNRSAVVVFCRSGNRSGQAKTILEQSGIPNVINGGTWQDVQQVLKS